MPWIFAFFLFITLFTIFLSSLISMMIPILLFFSISRNIRKKKYYNWCNNCTWCIVLYIYFLKKKKKELAYKSERKYNFTAKYVIWKTNRKSLNNEVLTFNYHILFNSATYDLALLILFFFFSNVLYRMKICARKYIKLLYKRVCKL